MGDEVPLQVFISNQQVGRGCLYQRWIGSDGGTVSRQNVKDSTRYIEVLIVRAMN